MNGAHLHLIMNHFPIVGTIIGMLILLAGILLKNVTVKQTGLVTLVVSALSVTVALLTGDPAEEAVRGLPGVTNALIEHHEDIAYSSLWILIPMGLLAALAFYSLWKKERSGNILSMISFFLSIVAIVIMTWVGLTGGQIRHTEIRNQNSTVAPAADKPGNGNN